MVVAFLIVGYYMDSLYILDIAIFRYCKILPCHEVVVAFFNGGCQGMFASYKLILEGSNLMDALFFLYFYNLKSLIG